ALGILLRAGFRDVAAVADGGAPPLVDRVARARHFPLAPRRGLGPAAFPRRRSCARTVLREARAPGDPPARRESGLQRPIPRAVVDFALDRLLVPPARCGRQFPSKPAGDSGRRALL